jgi:hypothetical protein
MIAAWLGQNLASRRSRMPVNALSMAHLPGKWQLNIGVNDESVSPEANGLLVAQ